VTTTDHHDKTKRRGAGGKKKKTAEVIHVAFGPGGGRISPDASEHANANGAGHANGFSGALTDRKHPSIPPQPSGAQAEPVSDTFTPKEVCKLLGLKPARLRALDKSGIVSPSGQREGKRVYTFQDLIALRATHDLLAQHVKIRDVAKAIGALRSSLPRVTRPLQELRIVGDGRRVVVRADGGAFEPVSGQMVLDFQVNTLREDVVRVLRPRASRELAKTAYELYTQASGLDEDPATFDEAEALYKRALELDPHLAIALTNLGNIRFRRGDEQGAVDHYMRALEIDDRQPEAHYNLGYVMLERGEPRRAIHYFERALAADPRFADAHFNLAMAYEQVGERAKARPHWKRYLEVEPTGTWADIAREHLT
jgi:DNA-binding transcriptional MerR regulator